jgi:hypothetical protein
MVSVWIVVSMAQSFSSCARLRRTTALRLQRQVGGVGLLGLGLSPALK